MKNYFMDVLRELPTGKHDDFLQVSVGKTTKFFMDPIKVMGIADQKLIDKTYFEACTELTWDEFQKHNAIYAMTGKHFYNPRYIGKAIAILRALGWSKGDIIVHLPCKEAPVMFSTGSSDMALFIAPMVGRDMSALIENNPKEEGKK